MDKYKKGRNVEQDEVEWRACLPQAVAGGDALWLRVQGGTRIEGAVEPALRQLRDGRPVVWSGSGAAARKAVTCAELCKRRLPGQLHQITRLCWLRCDEHWLPLTEGLDELVVRRHVPALHLLLSPKPLDPALPGYQAPTDNHST